MLVGPVGKVLFYPIFLCIYPVTVSVTYLNKIQQRKYTCENSTSFPYRDTFLRKTWKLPMVASPSANERCLPLTSIL